MMSGRQEFSWGFLRERKSFRSADARRLGQAKYIYPLLPIFCCRCTFRSEPYGNACYTGCILQKPAAELSLGLG